MFEYIKIPIPIKLTIISSKTIFPNVSKFSIKINEYFKSISCKDKAIIFPLNNIIEEPKYTERIVVKKAKNILQKGGIVILSPAAPSYNLYKNFEARGEDFINCIIKPEPTYLGESIPVSGDGDITNDKQ